ncbi:CidA/LrgA family protein [Paenibacillus piri]|uniref:CidA/LrgA family holin-like protein n=1 Tax=Paenibacillus piri TaxID=2547395 RepID=A0A4R5KZZ1_9BACL|nr:CidA/LrgA family holin-like protein [Paenibacillus piri]TDG00778.1 CidA/LrgA family holin-like protein [Paenibacillus piri]
MKTLLKTVFQIILLIVISQLTDAFVRWMQLPVPGSIVGIVVLFALLKLNILRLEWIELGSKWLLAEMLLFFIPATVGIVNYKSLVVHSGLPIAVTIICSTAAVMLCSGLIGQRLSARKEGETG